MWFSFLCIGIILFLTWILGTIGATRYGISPEVAQDMGLDGGQSGLPASPSAGGDYGKPSTTFGGYGQSDIPMQPINSRVATDMYGQPVMV